MRTPISLLAAGLCVLLPAVAMAASTEGVPVAVGMAQQRQIFREVRITGSVTSPRVAQLSPATSGLVAQVRVDAGDRVAAGDILLTLDAELAELQLRSASAQQVQAATALEDAERRLREARQLAPQQSIAETAVRALEAEVAGDRAALDRATADTDYQRAVLERHRLKAPFAGVISSKLTDPGEWVNQGQGVLELVATDGLRLDFAVPEDYLAALTPDAAVAFSLAARPGEQYAGRVQTIVPVTDPGARTFLLRVQPAQGGALIPGMSAYATLQIPDRASGVAVPRDATLSFPDGRVVVWTVEDGGDGPVVSEHVVEAGAAFDGLVEIREGLAPGAKVVIQGNEALKDGQRVRIVNPR